MSAAHEVPTGLLLALDASTFQATAALVDVAGEPRGRWTQAPGQRGTAALAPAVAALLADAGLGVGELLGVVVGTGPGSYTGLRAVIAFARGLCLPSGRPLAGCPSVASAAAACFAARPEVQRVVTLLDARRDQLYRADYERCAAGARETAAPHLVPAASVEALLASDDVGLAVLREPEPDALWLGRLAGPRLPRGGDDPRLVLPLYLKPSHAEIALAERRR